MNQNGKAAAILLVIVLLVASAAGGYIAGLYKEGQKQDQKAVSSGPDASTKAADFRVLLNNIFSERVDLTATNLRAGYEGHETFDPSSQALDENSRLLASTLSGYLGQETRGKLYEALSSQSGRFVSYMRAVKNGDRAAMNKASQELDNGAEKLASTLSGNSTGLTEEDIKVLIDEHITNIKNVVDEHDAGDNSGSLQTQAVARAHVSRLADTLAEAIIKKSPDKFTDN